VLFIGGGLLLVKPVFQFLLPETLINEAGPIFVKGKRHFIRGNVRILIKDGNGF
jgi:hypothetical protein